MSDGVELATDVYVPAAPHTARPTVLSRIPYDRGGALCFLPVLAQRFLERGWVFVGQDVRGKFGSSGDRVPFASEIDDGRTTLDWICSQPWSDGRVVMVGDSYCGYTQLAAAASGHEALRGITPRVTSAEIEADWLWHQGVPCLATAAAWAMFAWSRADLAEGTWQFDCVPTSALAERNLGHDLAVLDQWYGDRRTATPVLAPWTVPTLHLAGWWDVFQRGQFLTWSRQRAFDPDSVWLHVADTDHQWTEIRRDGTASSGRTASGAPTDEFIDRYLAPIMPFFDHVLNGAPAPARIEVTVVGAEVTAATSWPPPDAVFDEVYLVDGHRAHHGPEGGGLAWHADSRPTSVAWVHDPTHPVPDLVADPWSLAPGLPDEREVELRDDVITFTGTLLSHPLTLLGPVEMVGVVEADGPSTDVVAKLVDVDPLGRARRICEGIALAEGPFPSRCIIDLGQVAYRLDPGHLLRLEIASSMFPRYAVHPGTDEPAWSATGRRACRQWLHLGPGQSHLRIWRSPDEPQSPHDPTFNAHHHHGGTQ